MSEVKKWHGAWPTICNMCGDWLPDNSYFVDGADQQGHWGLFCPACVQDYNIKLGTGRGQKYDSKTLVKLEG